MYEIRLAPSSLQNIWLPMEAEPAKYGFILTATFPESEKESKNRRVRRKQGNAIHLVWAALRGLGVLIRGRAKCPAWLPNGSGPSLRQSALAGSWPPGSPLPPLFLPGPSPPGARRALEGLARPDKCGEKGSRGSGCWGRLGTARESGEGGRGGAASAQVCFQVRGGWGARLGAAARSGPGERGSGKLGAKVAHPPPPPKTSHLFIFF